MPPDSSAVRGANCSADCAAINRVPLENRFRVGTTHILFSPEDFIARLAALVPHPRVYISRYHGVFAPSSPLRPAIVLTPAAGSDESPKTRPTPGDPGTLKHRPPIAPIRPPRR